MSPAKPLPTPTSPPTRHPISPAPPSSLYCVTSSLRCFAPRSSHSVTPLESALPQKQTCHFITPIESIRFSQALPFLTKLAPVTPVSTTLTKHTPRNPIRMNTSEKHQEGSKPKSHLSDLDSTSYREHDAHWSDHFAPRTNRQEDAAHLSRCITVFIRSRMERTTAASPIAVLIMAWYTARSGHSTWKYFGTNSTRSWSTVSTNCSASCSLLPPARRRRTLSSRGAYRNTRRVSRRLLRKCCEPRPTMTQLPVFAACCTTSLVNFRMHSLSTSFSLWALRLPS